MGNISTITRDGIAKVKKAYLEANAIWRFSDEGSTGEEARAILSCHGFEPVIGLHVIYELAKTYLREDSPDTSVNLFSIVRDLKPQISETPGALLKYEFQNFLSGATFDPFLLGARKRETVIEISKLSRGVFDEKAKAFVTARESQSKKDRFIRGQYNIDLLKKDKPKIEQRTFEGVVSHYKDDTTIMVPMVEQILSGIANTHQSQEIYKKLDSYPVLKTTVMANLYEMFIALVDQIPGKDKTHDHRHLIEASYCDVFVTEDRKLLNNTKRINPSLAAIEWSDIGKSVNLGSVL